MASKITEKVPYEDFKRIYQVFGEKPYEEKYTEEDFQEIYEEYIKKGKIYGAYVEERLVGIIAVTDGIKKGQPVNFGNKKVTNTTLIQNNIKDLNLNNENNENDNKYNESNNI